MAYKNTSYANRGAAFERLIIMANNKYRNSGIADIRKVPRQYKLLKTMDVLSKGGKKKQNGSILPEYIKADLLPSMRRK
ncbi:hypothetical protein ACFTQ7_12750 [Lysinibacillus sp. NPDC056959]|uniref:hypothetical protein n=1 Tax=Lysinibacillus sp. NPDC056959 TaxID=3345981 RepID=UPI00363E0C86